MLDYLRPATFDERNPYGYREQAPWTPTPQPELAYAGEHEGGTVYQVPTPGDERLWFLLVRKGGGFCLYYTVLSSSAHFVIFDTLDLETPHD